MAWIKIRLEGDHFSFHVKQTARGEACFGGRWLCRRRVPEDDPGSETLRGPRLCSPSRQRPHPEHQSEAALLPVCSLAPEDVEVTEVAGADRTPSPCTTFRLRAQDSLLPWDASRPHLPVARTRSPSRCFICESPHGIAFQTPARGPVPYVCICSFAQMGESVLLTRGGENAT